MYLSAKAVPVVLGHVRIHVEQDPPQINLRAGELACLAQYFDHT
jgi:hypothetical protein